MTVSTPRSSDGTGRLQSLAAPHVSAIVALMLARNPNLSPDQVQALLKGTARSMSNGACPGGGCGGGLVDAAAAVAAAAP